MEVANDMKEYWRTIRTTVKTLKTGLNTTARHLRHATNSRSPLAPEVDNYFEKHEALFTVQYPKEQLPIPDHGRYKLHNEIDDCIVCDKCAKICPVDCIDIEPVRSADEIGKTSDGTAKRIYAAKFDIDMAKCCFCGLCTTVCPTECLTMTNEFDFSAFDFVEHNIAFGEMTPLQILEAKEKWEQAQAEKQKLAANKAQERPQLSTQGTKPKVGTAKVQVKPNQGGASDQAPAKATGRPVFRPKIKVVKKTDDATDEKKSEGKSEKPPIRPKLPKRKNENEK